MLHRRLSLLVAAALVFMGVEGRAHADETREYDAIIVGGGPSGYAAALSAQKNGAKRVLVLEKRDGGGKGRIQTLLVQRSTIAQLKSLGVDVSAEGSPFRNMESLAIGKPSLAIKPRSSVDSIEPAGPGAKSASMFLKPDPMSFVAIDDSVAIERATAEAKRADGIEIVEGMEAVKIEVGPKGNVEIIAEERDERGRPIAGSTKVSQFRGRYVGIAGGLSEGLAQSLGVSKVRQGPTYRMATAVFKDTDMNHVGKALLTHYEHDGMKYRVLFGGGKPGETTVTLDLPESVDHTSPAAVAKFAARAAGSANFISAHGGEPALVKTPSVYDAQRTNADRFLVGNKGSENVMILGDAAFTGTPWTALGYNVSVHNGALFGEFVGRAESARSPQEAASVRKWLNARMTSQMGALHSLDRAMHVVMRAPHNQGAQGLTRAVNDVKASVADSGRAAKAWTAYGAARVVQVAKNLSPRDRDLHHSSTDSSARRPIAMTRR